MCRYCGREHASGILLPLALAGAATVAGFVLLWFGPPLLGAIIVIGGMSGLLVSMLPASIEFIARWLGR